jgi:hypothetical protein
MATSISAFAGKGVFAIAILAATASSAMDRVGIE